MMHSQPHSAFSRLLKLCLSLLIALPVPLVAQDSVTGAFAGIVTNQIANQPVGGATVEITSALTQASVIIRTDAQGRFYYGLLNPGVYTITISAPGYDAQTLTRTVLATQVNTVIPIPVQLTPTVTPPQPPTVQGVNKEITVTGPAAGIGGKSEPPSPGSAPGDRPALAAEINRTDGRRGGAFTAEAVSTLPLGATTFTRSFDELALLLPGVALPPETQGGVAGPGVGAGVGSAGQFAVNGLRSRANNFTVDGSDNNDEDIGVRRQGFFALVPQPIESVQEYQVATLLAPAQYGRNLGAQVNAVSKTGGSAVHGAVYGFLNTRALNSTDFFDTTHREPAVAVRSVGGQPVLDCTGIPSGNFFANDCRQRNRQLSVANNSTGKDPLTFGQGGFAFGAPLVRERLFSFFSYERQVLNARREAHFAVPTVDERGIFGSGASGFFFTNSAGQLVRAFPASRRGGAIFSLFPFPNDPDGVYGANTFSQELPASARGNIASIRLDGNFDFNGRRQTATARYNLTDDWREIPVTGGALFSTLRPRVRTHNFSSYVNGALGHAWLNQLRFSYGRTRLFFEEVRDPFLLPSKASPNEPFLLNAREIQNRTMSASDGPNPVLYLTTGFTTEDLLGRVGQVKIGGYSPVGVDVFNFPQRRVNNTYQIADTLTWQLGAGTLTTGADMRRSELNSDLPRNSRTLINFDGAPLFEVTRDKVQFVRYLAPVDLAAAGVPSGAFLSLARDSSVSSAIGLRYYQLNFFGQTEWRVRQNLSLSAGLRYEYNTVPHETRGRIEKTFSDPLLRDEKLSGFIGGLNRFIDGRTTIYEPDRNNFAPRVGLAYARDLFGAGRTTVFRAGYGVFYDQILGAVVSQSRNVFPNFITVNNGGFTQPPFVPDTRIGRLSYVTPATGGFGTTPLIQPGTLNTLNPALPLNTVLGVLGGIQFPTPFGATLPTRHLEMPRAQHYSLTIEQQLHPNLVVTLAYVGTQGHNLLRFTTPNLGPNNVAEVYGGGEDQQEPFLFGTVFAPPSGRPVGGVGAVSIYETTARSRYDALQLQVRGRFSRSLEYQAAYTFSKALDDVSDVFDLAGAAALPQNSLKPDERGPANFDARHRVAYQVTYALPTLSGSPAVGRLFFGGWEILSTGQFQTGQPFTVNSLIDINLDGNLTDRLNPTNRIQVTGDRRQPLRRLVEPANLINPYPNFGSDGRVGRNTFRAGNYLLLNLAVVKNFSLTEQQRVTLRAEFFNFTNRANFGVPVRFLEAPGFGQATDTVTPGRRVQFALKYSF